MKRRYWFVDPEKLKEKYLMALPFLSLEDIEVHYITTEDKKRLTELETLMSNKDIELKDAKERLKHIAKYMEGKERVDNVKKPG